VCQAVKIVFKLLHIHYLRIQLETSRRFFFKCDEVMWISLFLHKAVTLIKFLITPTSLVELMRRI
jgi:hypothetical protein